MARVATVEAYRFIIDCLKAVGADNDVAETHAKLLVQANRIGLAGHGINKLESFINDIQNGACKPNNKPVVLKESASTAWIDAKNCMGSTVSNCAMDIAIQKARKTGVGWVVVKGSFYNGIAGYWAQKAADEGMIGIAFSNTAPVMVPTRSKEPALGMNPIAVAAPATNGESFFIDMATTSSDLGKIEMQLRKGEPIPPGWALGKNGKETLDPQEALETKLLYPLGGSDDQVGFKGFCLGAMVEVLCGICAGSNFGQRVPPWPKTGYTSPPNIAHCFIAVDPNCFAPGFTERLSEIIEEWRDLEPVDPDLPVLAPGDREKISACKSDKTCSVPLPPSLVEANEALAAKLKVKPMELLENKKKTN